MLLQLLLNLLPFFVQSDWLGSYDFLKNAVKIQFV